MLYIIAAHYWNDDSLDVISRSTYISYLYIVYFEIIFHVHTPYYPALLATTGVAQVPFK